MLNYGYSHPEIVRAVRAQSRRLAHFAGTDYYNELQVELAERLVEITPGDFQKRVFFSNSGAEAVEAAFKCVRLHTRKPGVISFKGSFHGRTFGALSLTDSDSAHRDWFEPLVPGVRFVPFAYCYRCSFDRHYPGCDFQCVEHIRKSIPSMQAEGVGALITEPIQGASGYIIPPPEFHPMIKELCDQRDLIFIVDEIQTCLGRTGKYFAIEHWNVVPDVICIAKPLACGMVPMGATIARADVMDWKPGSHANTFGGNMLACAAALAGLKLLERRRLVDRAAKLGRRALKRLEEIAEHHELVGEVRGRGLMLAIEFVKDRKTKEPAREERDAIVRAALGRGLMVFRGGKSAIRIAPPLIIDREDLNLGFDILERAIEEVEG